MHSHSGRAITVTSILFTALNVAGLVLIGPVIAVTRHDFVDVFSDFDVELPGLTLLFLNAPWWALSLGGLGLAAALVLGEYSIAAKHTTITINAIVAVALGLLLVIWTIAMAMPMYQIMDHLNSP